MDSFSSIANLRIESSNSAGSLYFLQANPNNSGTMECVPLQLIMNEHINEHYLRPVHLDKDLQLCTDACATPSSLHLVGNEIVYQETTKSEFNVVEKASSSLINTKQSIPKVEAKYSKKTSNQEIYKAKIENTNRNRNERQQQLTQKFVHIADRAVPPRAIAVLPTDLQYRRELVSPRRPLPVRVRFGPLQGISHKVLPAEVTKLISYAAASHAPIFLIKKGNSIEHIDVSDKDKSSWLSLLPLGDQNTANVWLYEESGEIYGVTTKSIAPRRPLVLGYSKKYAEDYGLPPGQPTLDLNEEVLAGPRQWWCFECHRAMGSAILLERHIDVYHKEEKPLPRRRHRCPHCSRTFSRLFTLKRHIQSFCKKKVNNQLNTELSQIKTNGGLCATQNTDDTKAPSDESLQNYTNGLDFSTNLFDTDRMPNLDISGSSRSETEFNPYNICFKEENSLANDVGYSNRSNKDKATAEEKILASCPYCDKTIVNAKKRQHLKECTARRFECECGQVFNKKQMLEQHIDKEHSDLKSRTLKEAAQAKISRESSYKCEDCKVSFKRRGMLVNHLWRVHNSLTTQVPMERRVRHYPCVACPKIYRTASKRDRHAKNHHPGTELIRAAPIEGERKACEPASCWECPRQYATRAKLLQHMRAHHPHLDLPMRLKSKKNSPY